MTGNQIRQKYLDFFKNKQHAILPSSPLVPENDPTTLFTGSGMQPLLPYFLGQPHPQGTRVCDSQKCFRSQDIEEVGDNRHTTFFEMLGNWSFGDYFKQEQLAWIFEFLTKEIGLDPNKLYVSVYTGNSKLNIPQDDEAIQLWQKLFKEAGIEAKVGQRIFKFENDNWWSRVGAPENMPVGEPGGPDSEIFYDFGPDLKLHENSPWKDQPCGVQCDCGRYLEIGNSVFMTYQKQEDGSFRELENKNIDFGGGLERILSALHNSPDVFTTDLFMPLISKIEEISQTKYVDHQIEYRVIADHVKASVFLTADGVIPANKEQGYFLRRLLRRAIRYGKKINLDQNFLAELVPSVAQIYLEAYPELDNQKEKIASIFTKEENKFQKAINKGLKKLEKLSKLDGQTAFDLYQTYGFPLELSLEEAQELQIKIAKNIHQDFQTELEKHAAQSRTASAGMFKGGLADASDVTTKYHTATHLLQAALRLHLGPEIAQRGSNITHKRMRFDFSFNRALTPEERETIEKQINDWINQDLEVTRQEMSKQEALDNDSIMSLFADKYPDQVSVYSIGPKSKFISRELCGGPHVEKTSQIGEIKITKEKSAASGVRRIYVELKNLYNQPNGDR
jgi:alanyl-tRNA synthetase